MRRTARPAWAAAVADTPRSVLQADAKPTPTAVPGGSAVSTITVVERSVFARRRSMRVRKRATASQDNAVVTSATAGAAKQTWSA